jgi:putative ABC transport system permease protein
LAAIRTNVPGNPQHGYKDLAPDMFRNILVTSFRALSKRKFFTLLNISGLAISMAFAFLLWLFIQDQTSYEKHFRFANRIYRVNADFSMNGKRDIYSNCPRPMGPTLMSEYPEVENAVRVCGVGGLFYHNGTLILDDKQVKTQDIYFVDSTYFAVFDHQFLAGNPATALREPNSLVLTESLAKKFFPNGVDALGKTLHLPGFAPKNLKITGVVADPSTRTHLPIEAWVSWTTFPYQDERTQWYGAHVYTYILLNEANDPDALLAKFPTFYEKYMKQTFEELDGTANLILQPLLNIHLDPEYVWEPNPHGSATNVRILAIIMVFLLMIAAINYVNLTTARSAERAGEVGVRKTLGAKDEILLIQFMGESILIAILSAIVGLLIALVLLPNFNALSGLKLDLRSILEGRNILFLGGASIVLGVLAGVYPALYLTALQPVEVLKGKFATTRRGETLRKALVVVQYCMSAILISAIFFVAEQTSFVKNKDIGYNKFNVIRVNIPADTAVVGHLDTFAEKLKTSANVLGTTMTSYALNQEGNHFTPTLENPDGTRFQTGVDFITVDYDFVETMGAEVVKGRNFDRESRTDESSAFLINETAVQHFGWEDNPLGGKFVGMYPDTVVVYNVIGVVRDFNLGASYQKVHPTLLFLESETARVVYARINPEGVIASIEDIRKVWESMFPKYTFEYTFLDEELAAIYEKEEKFLQLLLAFSVVAVLITCLGIVGLISFSTELRKKEIAIRKVNGSPMSAIIGLLCWNFLLLLVIANLVAIPIAAYLIYLWLNTFAYHISMSWSPFLLAILISVVFTAVALAYHAVRAANANPVDALRYE